MLNRISDVLSSFSANSRDELVSLSQPAVLSGRIHARRIHRNTSFYTLFWDGSSIQVVLHHQMGNYAQWTEQLLVGDIIQVTGVVGRTLRGELSLLANSLTLISHCQRNLDITGTRAENFDYSRRDQAIISNPEMLEIFRSRSLIMQYIRQFMYSHQFLEMDTPLLQTEASGAAARTFQTFCEANNSNLHLRIAPETYLVRSLSCGFSRIFEMGRNFRNEGVSARHQPEFTMMEAYQAFADWEWAMDTVEQIFNHVGGLLGRTPFVFVRATIQDILLRHFTQEQITDRNFIIQHLSLQDMGMSLPMLQYHLFETLEHTLIEPTFVLRHPVEISPLSAVDNEGTQRFELFMNGIEIANGFTQLIDAAEQRHRFATQSGNEVMSADNLYIESMEYGFPSIGGFGIGIDRFIMMMTDRNDIREVVMFPH